jgi:hypothetical protein
MKEIAKSITPPILWNAAARIKHFLGPEPPPEPPPELFGGDNSLFKSVLATTRLYGEYGCGASTNWVLANTAADVRSVDTSKEWIDEVLGHLDADALGRISIFHADLGEVGCWGRPQSYEKRHLFDRYTDWIWEHENLPDTVLIDGRFRVCCFLTCLKYARAGTRLIFDDYMDRPYYHIVEKFLPRADTCGRQCLFIAPDSALIDYSEVELEISKFRHVMD